MPSASINAPNPPLPPASPLVLPEVWAASSTNARAPSTVQGIEPLQIMVTAKDLPTVEFADYTFVFAH